MKISWKYRQSGKLLLVDVFENFQNECLKIYEPLPTKFLSAPGLALKAVLKNTKVKLDHLTDTDLILTVEKETRGGLYHSIYRYAKSNNKFMSNYDKNKEPLFI